MQLPPLPQLKVTVVESPGTVSLERPFRITLRVHNGRSEYNTLSLSLSSTLVCSSCRLWLTEHIAKDSWYWCASSLIVCLLPLQWWTNEASICTGETPRSWHPLDWRDGEGIRISNPNELPAGGSMDMIVSLLPVLPGLQVCVSLQLCLVAKVMLCNVANVSAHSTFTVIRICRFSI